jgi:hypothetical protein
MSDTVDPSFGRLVEMLEQRTFELAEARENSRAFSDELMKEERKLAECRRELDEARAALDGVRTWVWGVGHAVPGASDGRFGFSNLRYDAWLEKHAAALKAARDMAEQVRLSQQIVQEVIEEEQAAALEGK